MIVVKHLIEDPMYDYVVNHYQGMYALDYLINQLAVWVKNDFEEFNLVLTGLFTLQLEENEKVPKLLRRCVNINDNNWLSVECYSLAYPYADNKPVPDNTGAVPLWYDVIELPNKRAERSLVRLLDQYCEHGPEKRDRKKVKKSTPDRTSTPKKKNSRKKNGNKKGKGKNRGRGYSKRKA